MERVGDVFSWGSGEMGQLGYSPAEVAELPRDTDGFPFQPQPGLMRGLANYRITQVAGGDGHSVAVTASGRVLVWGASACGQLGLSDMNEMPTDAEGYPYQPEPKLVEDLGDYHIVQVACGDAHTVALTAEGLVFSWGGGGCGQLGHPDTAQMPKDEDGCPYQPTPRLVEDLAAVVCYVACGKAHTVVVCAEGHLYSWGAGACGQLGHPDTSNFPFDEDGYPFHPTPRMVASLRGVRLVAAACGDVHTLALAEDGGLYCFGGGSFGQLGLGNVKNLPVDVDECPFMPAPKLIESLRPVHIVKIACGDSHSMAIANTGELYGWGAAACGQLGIEDLSHLPRDADSSPYEPDPQLTHLLKGKVVVAAACGEAHTLVLTDKGALYSFGAASFGQLGSSPQDSPRKSTRQSSDKVPRPCQYTPRLITSLLSRKVLSIACGGVHNLAVVESQQSLSSDLFRLYQAQQLCDVSFTLTAGSRDEKVSCHKIVLARKSALFKEILRRESVITLPNSKTIFCKFIDFLYQEDLETATAALQHESMSGVAEMMQLAQAHALLSLVGVCQARFAAQLKPHVKVVSSPSEVPGLVFLSDGRAAFLDPTAYQQLLSSAVLIDLNSPLKTKPISPRIVDFSDFFDREEFSDVKLVVESRPIYCHRSVLAARSQFFSALYSHGFKESKEKVVEIGDVTFDMMSLLLRHLYSDSLEVEQSQVTDLLVLCDRFSVNALKRRCEQTQVSTLNVDNAAALYQLAKNFECGGLKEAVLVYIEERFSEVIETQTFEELDKRSMLEIMRFKKNYK